MDGLLLLVIAALLVALFAALGLWGRRRISRTTSFETRARPAAVALRTSGSHLAGDNDDAVRKGHRGGASARNAPDTPSGGTAVIPTEPTLGGPEAGGAPEYVPVKEYARDKEAQPCEGGVIAPPPSPPPLADAPAPAASADGGAATESAELDLTSARRNKPQAEDANHNAPLKTESSMARLVDAAADQDGAVPLPAPPDTAVEPYETIPAVPDGVDDIREEAPTDDPPRTDQDAIASAESRSRDREDANLPSLAPEVPAQEGPGHTEPAPGAGPSLKPALETPAGALIRQPRQPAVHRDRRGKRRVVAATEASAVPAPASPTPPARPPADAKLRLSLHPIRRTARLSIVLTRPEGFPERVTVQAGGDHLVEAYDARRYDDLDLPWTSELLEGELRLVGIDGLQWLRSARQVHIFAEDPNEPELISVSAGRAGIAHTLVCRSNDAEAVRTAAASTGSPELQTHDHWNSIPDGWVVLSGYTPVHAAAPPLPPGLRPLDPGEGLNISFAGGLAIRARVYAAGHPPRISITPAPGAASVTIGGEPATLTSDGTWVAPGWDTPGQHIVDVVPGPSASYEIAADPWMAGGWEFWDAYPERFGDADRSPWARSRICGAQIRGPAEEFVLAAETRSTLIALGPTSGVTPLRRRDGVAVSVGLMTEPPAFLISATGQRRTQGRIVWLGLAPTQNTSRRHDADWVAAVRIAAARRLPLDRVDALGEEVWRKAKNRARRLKRRRPRA